MRGQAADYDHWRQLGLAGLGLGRRAAGLQAARESFSRRQRPSRRRRRMADRASARALGAARRVPRWRPSRPASSASTISTPATTRARATSTSTRSAAGAGRRRAAFSSRCSAARICGLRPAAWSKRVEFDGRRAAGVRYRQDGERRDRALPRRSHPRGRARSARCRPCCCPASARPRSLRELGIAVVLDKPGVGENLQDHLQLRMIYKVSGIKTLNETYRSLLGRAGWASTTRCAAAAR